MQYPHPCNTPTCAIPHCSTHHLCNKMFLPLGCAFTSQVVSFTNCFMFSPIVLWFHLATISCFYCWVCVFTQFCCCCLFLCFFCFWPVVLCFANSTCTGQWSSSSPITPSTAATSTLVTWWPPELSVERYVGLTVVRGFNCHTTNSKVVGSVRITVVRGWQVVLG